MIGALTDVFQTICIFILLYENWKMRQSKTPTLSESEEELPSELMSQLSLQEHVILRENKFDSRIEKLKKQLEEDGIELHPRVRNLPHDIIDKKPPTPEFEVAD